MYQFLTTTFFSILIFVTFDFLLSLHIHLDKVKQEHCLTKCTNGLIGGLDTAIFKSEVNRSEDPQAKYVYYQIGGGNETKFKTVCQLDLTKDCNLIAYSELCTCRYKDINVINLNISLAVQEHDNGTKLRGAVVRSNDSEPIYSELQELPIIYASDDTTGHLIINQEPIEMNSDLVKQFNGRELFIEYSCSSQGNPCVIEISTNDSNYKVEGKEHAVYYKSYNKSEVVIVTIRRALCSLVGKITTLRLEIHMNYQQAPKQDISIWGIVSTIFNIIFGIIIVYLGLQGSMKCPNRQNTIKRRQDNMDIEIEVQEGEHLHNQEHNALEVAVVVPNNENVGKEYNDDGEIMQRPEKTIDVDSPASFVEPLTLVERGYTNVPTIDMRTIKDKEIDRNCEDASTKNIHKRRETAQSSRFNSNPPPKSDSAPHLVMLSEAGDVHRVQKLLSDGADIDEKNNNGCTALMAAVKIGSIEIVTILLDKGADVNLNAENGYTALMYASYYYFGSTRIAQLLIDGGADVNSTEVNGWTSLMIASQKGHLDFVKLLIDKKAAINETNCKGDTALMFSASNGHLDIAQRLIYNGALINVKNKVGDTALKFAAEKGHKKLVQLFLKEKIDVDEVSTAKEIALQNNHTAVYDLIENFICPEVRNRITARL